jgi:hypothetical protein
MQPALTSANCDSKRSWFVADFCLFLRFADRIVRSLPSTGLVVLSFLLA